MASLLAIPQAWVETYRPLPTGWWSNHAEGIERVWPECAETVDRVAREVGVDPRLLVTRMELEQSAISYRWDGSTSHYGGGHDGDALKIKYLCGVDRTDSGDRPGGWFGAERQLLGCALRFRYWYRGEHGPRPEWRNWLGLGPTNASATLEGVEAANVATAMCYRYTPHLAAAKLLRLIGMEWFGEDYKAEENEATDMAVQAPSIIGHNLSFRSLSRRAATHGLIVHHSAGNQRATVESIHAYHRDSNHWAGIGYHYLIYPDGSIHRGRPEEMRGSHAGNANDWAIGVCVVGDYTNTPPSGAALNALAHLLAWLAGKHNWAWSSARTLSGHREWMSTACPGAAFYPLLPQVRADAKALSLGHAQPDGAQPDETETPESDPSETDEITGADFARHVLWAQQYGISDGSRLKDYATREEVLVMIGRLHSLLSEQAASQVEAQVEGYLSYVVAGLPWWKRVLLGGGSHDRR